MHTFIAAAAWFMWSLLLLVINHISFLSLLPYTPSSFPSSSFPSFLPACLPACLPSFLPPSLLPFHYIVNSLDKTLSKG